MLQAVLNNLEKIEDEAAKSLLAIYNGTQDKVGSDFYKSTVFESEANYFTTSQYFTSQIVGSVMRKMVETPLSFVRGNCSQVWFSSKDEGVSFGFTMVDYISKTPLVVATIYKEGTKYSYKSIMFDKATKTYKESVFSTKTCSNTEKLLELVLQNVNSDVEKWNNQYL